jgi:hypothetical protein
MTFKVKFHVTKFVSTRFPCTSVASYRSVFLFFLSTRTGTNDFDTKENATIRSRWKSAFTCLFTLLDPSVCSRIKIIILKIKVQVYICRFYLVVIQTILCFLILKWLFNFISKYDQTPTQFVYIYWTLGTLNSSPFYRKYNWS